MSHEETGVNRIEEGDTVGMMVVDEADEIIISQMELALPDIVRHLSGNFLESKASREKAGRRRRSVRYIWWEAHLYRREKKSLPVVVRQPEREKVMWAFHGELDHWSVGETQEM